MDNLTFWSTIIGLLASGVAIFIYFIEKLKEIYSNVNLKLIIILFLNFSLILLVSIAIFKILQTQIHEDKELKEIKIKITDFVHNTSDNKTQFSLSEIIIELDNGSNKDKSLYFKAIDELIDERKITQSSYPIDVYDNNSHRFQIYVYK